MPYSNLIHGYGTRRAEVKKIAAEGGWLYILPSKALADLSRARIICCKSIIEELRDLPLRQRAEERRLTMAMLCVYIMNKTLGPSAHRSVFDMYDLPGRAGNLFFIEEAEWNKLAAVPLEDNIIAKIIGNNLAKKMKEGRQTNLGRVGAGAARRQSQREAAIRELDVISGTEAVGARIFLDTLAGIWQVLPEPRLPTTPSYLALGLSRDHLGAVTFCMWPCNQVLTSTRIIEVKNPGKWREKFDVLFPTAERIRSIGNDHRRWGGGWRRIPGWMDYLTWTAAKSDEEVEELRAFFFSKFENLLWIPNFSIGGPVWRTRSGKVDVAHRV